jgi:hypothetical protein
VDYNARAVRDHSSRATVRVFEKYAQARVLRQARHDEPQHTVAPRDAAY